MVIYSFYAFSSAHHKVICNIHFDFLLLVFVYQVFQLFTAKARDLRECFLLPTVIYLTLFPYIWCTYSHNLLLSRLPCEWTVQLWRQEDFILWFETQPQPNYLFESHRNPYFCIHINNLYLFKSSSEEFSYHVKQQPSYQEPFYQQSSHQQPSS